MMHRAAPFLAFIGIVLAACAGAGPRMIRTGRQNYNEAIVATNNEQLLAMIVRMRYSEPSGLLAVASVTANMRLQANASTEVGIGPDASFAGNLVPLSVGGLYEDNPTISYTPVQGQEYLRQVLSPLPLDLTVLLLEALSDDPDAIGLLVKEINGVMFSQGDDGADGEGRFREMAGLLARLHRREELVWSAQADAPNTDCIIIREAGLSADPDVARARTLLGLTPPSEPAGVTAAPVVLGVGAFPGTVTIRTRSLFELFEIAAAAVDVPPEHVESGLARPVPPEYARVSAIRVRRSASRPRGALVAFQHYGWWYWIDAADGPSKATFRVLEAVMTARVADAAGANRATPVLTVPVSH